jgi:hypothetical protein
MYKLHPTNSMAIIRIADNAFIPFVDGNTDYQAYLKWLSEGNTPLEAETPADAT